MNDIGKVEYIRRSRNLQKEFEYINNFQEPCNAEFFHIQILVRYLLKKNPGMSKQDLVSKVTSLIQGDISVNKKQSNRKLVKVQN